MTRRCHLCGVVIRPAIAVVGGIPVCREHHRALAYPAPDLRPLPKRTALGVVFALSLLIAGTTTAQEKEPPPCVAVEPSDGARSGETLEQRIERLETALRLSKAEKRVRSARR